MPWNFTDEDRDRLQPILQKMMRLGNYVVGKAVEYGGDRDGAIAIIQGGCEFIAEMTRESILEQVDRGEWAARGITKREQMDITITVDAKRAYEDPDARLIALSIQPTEVLS